MEESIYITRAEFNQLKKQIAYLADFVKYSMQARTKSKWMNADEAMKEIGCKKRKLDYLRSQGVVDWRYAGEGKGVMLLRKSVESYIDNKSTMKINT